MRPGRIVAPLLPAAGLVLLGRMGGGALEVPLGSAAAFADWTGTTAPVPLAMALVRLAAQALCGYLLLATVLQSVAEALGYRWLHALATRAFPTVLRRTLTSGAGFGLAAGSILWTGGAPAGASIRPTVKVLAGHEDLAGRTTATMLLLPPAPSHATATMTLLDVTKPASDAPPAAAPATAAMQLLDPPHAEPTPAAPPATPPDTTTPTSGHPPPAAPAATATMRLLEPVSPESTPAPLPVAVPGTTAPNAGPSPAGPPNATATMRLLEPLPATAAPASDQTSGADEDEIWVVESGDSFWSIAEDMVGDGAALDAYWHQLIAANRERLAVPDQPDLLFPGQVLTLPKPATPGSEV